MKKMKHFNKKILAVVLLVCFLLGDTESLPNDEAAKNTIDDFVTDSVDLNVRGQYKLRLLLCKVH